MENSVQRLGIVECIQCSQKLTLAQFHCDLLKSYVVTRLQHLLFSLNGYVHQKPICMAQEQEIIYIIKIKHKASVLQISHHGESVLQLQGQNQTHGFTFNQELQRQSEKETNQKIFLVKLKCQIGGKVPFPVSPQIYAGKYILIYNNVNVYLSTGKYLLPVTQS